jgi:hypothetical protein
MPKKKKKTEETDSRKARLIGALAGLGIGSTTLQGYAQHPLADLIELGIQSYPEMSHDLPLWAEDYASAKRIKAYQRALGAERVPAVVSGHHGTLTPESIEFIERHPMLTGASKSDVAEIAGHGPRIFVRSPNPGAMAHEVGHTVRSPIHRASIVARHPLLRALGIGGGVAAALSDHEGVQGAAPFISVAPHIPELAEEARASLHGTRAVRATEGSAAALKALARMTPGFMTYLAAALPALAAPYVAKGIREYVQREGKGKGKKAEKTAAKIKIPKPPKATGRNILTARQRWLTPAVKPKATKPGKKSHMPVAKPPSKAKFYADMRKQMEGLGTREVK